MILSHAQVISAILLVTLFRWILRYGPHISSISIAWELDRNANSWTPPQTYLIGNSGDGDQQDLLVVLMLAKV